MGGAYDDWFGGLTPTPYPTEPPDPMTTDDWFAGMADDKPVLSPEAASESAPWISGNSKLEWLLDAINTPAQMVRGVLTQKPNENVWQSMERGAKTNVTGADVLQEYGVQQEPFNWTNPETYAKTAANLGVEFVTDPLTFAGGMIGDGIGWGVKTVGKLLTPIARAAAEYVPAIKTGAQLFSKTAFRGPEERGIIELADILAGKRAELDAQALNKAYEMSQSMFKVGKDAGLSADDIKNWTMYALETKSEPTVDALRAAITERKVMGATLAEELPGLTPETKQMLATTVREVGDRAVDINSKIPDNVIQNVLDIKASRIADVAKLDAMGIKTPQLEDPLLDYALHRLTPEAREALVKAYNGMGYGREFMPMHGSQLARNLPRGLSVQEYNILAEGGKLGELVPELADFKGKLFVDDPFQLSALRDIRDIKAATDLQLLNSAAEQFGRKIQPSFSYPKTYAVDDVIETDGVRLYRKMGDTTNDYVADPLTNIPVVRNQTSKGVPELGERGGTWFYKGNAESFPRAGKEVVRTTVSPNNPLIVDDHIAGSGAIEKLLGKGVRMDLEFDLTRKVASKMERQSLYAQRLEQLLPKNEVDKIFAEYERLKPSGDHWRFLEDRLATELAKRQGYDAIISKAANNHINEVVMLHAPITGSSAPANWKTLALLRNPDPRLDNIKPLFENMVFHPDVAEHLNKILYFDQVPESYNQFAKMIDSVHAVWKPLALNMRPATVFRNAVGNLWNNYLGGVKSARYIDAIKLQRPGGLAEGLELGGQHFTADQLKTLLLDHGIYGGFSTTESAQFLSAVDKKFTAFDIPGIGKMARTMFAANVDIENNARIAHFLSKLDDGLKAGNSVRQSALDATLSVKKYLFDYAEGLTDFERGVMRRAMPFYTFTRFNVPLQLSAIATPSGAKAYVRLGQIVNAVRDRTAQERIDEFGKTKLPEWITNNTGIPVQHDEDGNPEFFLLGGWLPAGDLATLLQPGAALDRVVGMISPLFKIPVEQATNSDTFLKRKIAEYPGEEQKFYKYSVPRRWVHVLRAVPVLAEWDKFIRSGDTNNLINPTQTSRLDVAMRYLTGMATYNVDMGMQQSSYVRQVEDLVRKYKTAAKRGDTANAEVLLKQIHEMLGDTE